MNIVHGTWIPRETDAFRQDGDFWLWVETDTPLRKRKHAQLHPFHLSGEPLETFLEEKLGVRLPYGGSIRRLLEERTILLPTADGVPFPSVELLPYVDVDMPEQWELCPWRVSCWRLRDVMLDLNDFHFQALHAAEDFQLGADLVFWHQYSQELKGILLSDAYIPSLRYREVPGKAKGKSPAPFELSAGWEFCSQRYGTIVQRYVACMPPVCRAGREGDGGSELYDSEALLRHFSECLLNYVVLSTPMTARVDTQVNGTLLHDCLHPSRPIAQSEESLELYRQWATWKDRLTAAHAESGATLCFMLQEASKADTDAWHVHFLLASKRDPSLKVPLADYWDLDDEAREALLPHFGADVERYLLLALGHAARVYPAVWDAMENDRPSGFRLTLEDAYAFLKEHAWVLEDAGYTVIVPSWWTPQGRRRAKVRLKTTAKSSGSNVKGYFSLDTLVEYDYQLSIGGDVVSPSEWEQLIAAKSPLVQFRGEWIELDRERMQGLLQFWEKRHEEQPEMTLLDLLKAAANDDDELEWEYDESLQDVLDSLQDKSAPQAIGELPNFQGTLREYQKRGVAWLRYLEGLGLNPCLADDMGLGKTVQVIAELVAERNERSDIAPTLLIAPTSVLGNWQREIERFAPHLRVLVHGGASRIKGEERFREACCEFDVVVTSFALARLDEKALRAVNWWRVVVDEAQNIKNPTSAQTRAITKLSSRHRLALTGTPVENRLRDLWSIFNFLNPGYLGKEAQFRKAFEIPIQKDNDVARSGTLKNLVEPFILRRLKTDRQIITDLPEKIEGKMYCNLTSEQASLYEAVVREVMDTLDDAEGMQRRGLILATMTRLKQVCNHPVQFLGDGSPFTSERSHKLRRFGEMLEEVMDNGESALVFTQFTEIGELLERYVRRTLHYNTFYLHGGTSMAKRDRMVQAFQDPESEPTVFILSVRAGGTGLTLTKANHVFHYDRWWNPAVEDQATDRAFRIGQRKNVFVHKFVSIGTIEERIDAMIEDKKSLANRIVGADESWLTELDNETFKDLITLRRTAVLSDV